MRFLYLNFLRGLDGRFGLLLGAAAGGQRQKRDQAQRQTQQPEPEGAG